MSQNENPIERFKFIKVEDFFAGYKDWHTLGSVTSHHFDALGRILSLTFQNNKNQPCMMLLHFPRKDTFRLRFNPGKSDISRFPMENTRCIVMDTFAHHHQLCDQQNPFSITCTGSGDHVEVITQDTDNKPFMKVAVSFDPFNLEVSRFHPEGREYVIMADAIPSIYYKEIRFKGTDDVDYSIIRTVKKPGTAKYIGFGEKGGTGLYKNNTRLTYFNFDNMRYRQIYNRGSLDDREPLYHSNPFFMEFYGVPAENSVYGIFIDNSAETFMDVGYLLSNRLMFGSLFGDLDYYVFAGDTCTDIMGAYTEFVGHARLKPRYILGYHQGCYGYDTREKLQYAADKYRQYQLPIDGLHIDVDIQQDYKTFTIDSVGKFPNPGEMFSLLKEKGFKCSTNITPIISDQNTGDYNTYIEGREAGYFVEDIRCLPHQDNRVIYQTYEGGREIDDLEGVSEGVNSGQPYEGRVYYGKDYGTTGCYADMGRKEVRRWWGEQYRYLFETGLEMVWQDMTTPAIGYNLDRSGHTPYYPPRGDMKSFPFDLMLTNNFLKKYYGESEGNGFSASGQEGTYSSSPAAKIRNLYSYNLHKATYHGLNYLECRGDKRNFIIGRGGFTGMHRFAGLWTGDNSSNWNFLKINIPQVLALGISGQPIAGEDIGGFESDQSWQHWADPELLIRWTSMGAFLPWFRNHYMGKPGSKYFQEPYAYQELLDPNSDTWRRIREQDPGLTYDTFMNSLPQDQLFMYTCVLPVCKYYIELRYRLLQLLYDAMFENTILGMPICRAMFLNDGHDTALFNDKIQFLDTQLFVGGDLLVAPVLEKQSRENAWGKRDIYLPAGSDWYCYMDNRQPLGAAVEGGTTIQDYDAHISNDKGHLGFIVPLYVRAGAVFPTIQLEQYVGELNGKGELNPVTINVYPGESGEYTMYLDDGVSRTSAPAGDPKYGTDPKAEGKYRSTKITHRFTGASLREINIERTHDNYTPKEDFFFAAVLHDPGELTTASGPLLKVTAFDKELPLLTGGTPADLAQQLSQSAVNAWYYNKDLGISFIKIFDTSASISLRLEYFK